jgi:hypothetical protein
MYNPAAVFPKVLMPSSGIEQPLALLKKECKDQFAATGTFGLRSYPMPVQPRAQDKRRKMIKKGRTKSWDEGTKKAKKVVQITDAGDGASSDSSSGVYGFNLDLVQTLYSDGVDGKPLLGAEKDGAKCVFSCRRCGGPHTWPTCENVDISHLLTVLKIAPWTDLSRLVVPEECSVEQDPESLSKVGGSVGSVASIIAVEQIVADVARFHGGVKTFVVVLPTNVQSTVGFAVKPALPLSSVASGRPIIRQAALVVPGAVDDAVRALLSQPKALNSKGIASAVYAQLLPAERKQISLRGVEQHVRNIAEYSPVLGRWYLQGASQLNTTAKKRTAPSGGAIRKRKKELKSSLATSIGGGVATHSVCALCSQIIGTRVAHSCVQCSLMYHERCLVSKPSQTSEFVCASCAPMQPRSRGKQFLWLELLLTYYCFCCST